MITPTFSAWFTDDPSNVIKRLILSFEEYTRRRWGGRVSQNKPALLLLTIQSRYYKTVEDLQRNLAKQRKFIILQIQRPFVLSKNENCFVPTTLKIESYF